MSVLQVMREGWPSLLTWHVNALHTLLLCCSLSETRIVALVKNRTSDMTVAIGDGANDVSMIQMDDVVVGISG
ncbi:hypothetical protein F2Q70_00030499 [Brassica cretica]|uniref:P-type ATPase C-terminal domain-containing protein n=1 Tax=Brassica cretica TaxID=69181 RepID=A0A8S9FKQ2_BRACR|nr:hypothetical protein F2Q70_00030499 [Brassica cretica]